VHDQLLPETGQALPVKTAAGCSRETITKLGVVNQEFAYQVLQLRELLCRRKQFLLFRREMDFNLALELLLDFRLPGLQVNFSRLQRTIEAHAQRQRVLVLPRKRDEAGVTQHVAMIYEGGRSPPPPDPIEY